jgi:hypothetical protein
MPDDTPKNNPPALDVSPNRAMPCDGFQVGVATHPQHDAMIVVTFQGADMATLPILLSHEKCVQLRGALRRQMDLLWPKGKGVSVTNN